MECYGLLTSSPIPSIYSKHKIFYPLLLILSLLCMKSHHQDNKSCPLSPDYLLPPLISVALPQLPSHMLDKLSPALLRFLSPEHLWWHHLSQHWHHIEFAPIPLPQTTHGYLPLCGLTAGSQPITINSVLEAMLKNPLRNSWIQTAIRITPKI